MGDCQSLPFDDDSFDVVVSSFGVIFAPDPERAASELSRVCRGRLVITAWMPQPGRELWPAGDATCTGSRRWASDGELARMLPDFALESEERVWWLEGQSGEAIWSWVVRSSPPTRARLRALPESQLRSIRAA